MARPGTLALGICLAIALFVLFSGHTETAALGGKIPDGYASFSGERGVLGIADRPRLIEVGEEKERERGDGDGEEGEKDDGDEKYVEPSPLTLGNFFCAGWKEPFKERSSEGRAVRIPLFRTKLGFLEREFRGAFQLANNTDYGSADEHELEVELALPFNRRFMVELSPEYTWARPEDSSNWDAPSWTGRGAIQLVDTYNAAINVQFSVGTPMRGSDQASPAALGVALASFFDLGRRVGLQASLGYDSFAGPVGDDGVLGELDYSVGLTKTLTEKVPLFSNLTAVIEMSGVTQLDGGDPGRTIFSLVPEVQWQLRNEWWVSAGIEVPVTGPRPFDEIFHFATYKDF